MDLDDQQPDRRQELRREYDRDLERWRGEVEARVASLEREKVTIDTVAQAVVQMRIDMGVMRQELRESRQENKMVAKKLEEIHDSQETDRKEARDGREADRKDFRDLLDTKTAVVSRWTLALVPPVITGSIVGVIVIALGGHFP